MWQDQIQPTFPSTFGEPQSFIAQYCITFAIAQDCNASLSATSAIASDNLAEYTAAMRNPNARPQCTMQMHVRIS